MIEQPVSFKSDDEISTQPLQQLMTELGDLYGNELFECLVEKL